MNDQMTSPVVADDEIDLVELVQTLLSGWKIILLSTVLFAVGAVGYLKFKAEPYYTASMVLMLKGEEKTPTLGGAGMLGALGGGLLSSSGSSNLAKLEYLVKDPHFKIAFIERHGYLPKLFAERWDSVAGAWGVEVVEDSLVPDAYDGVERLNGLVTVSVDKKESVVSLKATDEDADFLVPFLLNYAQFLDSVLVKDRQDGANTQIDEYEKKYNESVNPWFKTKVESMLADQYEQLLLFAESALDVVVQPITPRLPAGPNKKLIAIVSVFLGGVIGVFAVFVFKWISLFKTEIASRSKGNVSQVS